MTFWLTTFLISPSNAGRELEDCSTALRPQLSCLICSKYEPPESATSEPSGQTMRLFLMSSTCVCVRGPEGNISLTEVTVCHRDTMSQQRHMGEACVIIWNMIDEDERRLTDDLSCISTQHYGCTNSKSALVLPSRPNDATLIDDVLCFSCKHRREPQPQFDLSFF